MRLGRRFPAVFLGFGLAGLAPSSAHAAQTGLESLSAIWAAPFIGLLLSIALFPLAAPKVWHAHFGKVSLFWALAFLLPFALAFDVTLAAKLSLHTLLAEFIPFIIVLFTLYTVAGGIYLAGNLHGSAALNTAFLGFGSLAASLIGTTGASVVLIRPLIRANDARRYNVHVIVFFIFLVSNIGGALTPLGDPPLFLGYLKGVPFFWPLQYLLSPALLCLGLLLAIFYALDSYFFHREKHLPGRKLKDTTPDTQGLRLVGGINLVLMVLVIAVVLFSAQLNLGSTALFETSLAWNALLRDALLLAIAFASLKLTPRSARIGNEFTWGPIAEVTKLFAAIFITAVPVLAIVAQGKDGAFGFLTQAVTFADGQPNSAAYFWMTGLLSAFLDNAPAYLVFFELAGGSADQLISSGAKTLTAISCGAVFMGAMTYIGNAPNFMVRAIAQQHGIEMPAFLGFFGWACLILLPVFALVSLLFFS